MSQRPELFRNRPRDFLVWAALLAAVAFNAVEAGAQEVALKVHVVGTGGGKAGFYGGNGAPAFSTAPISQTVNAGTPVVFRAEAAGTPTPTYQWLKDGALLSDGNGLSGSASATLFISAGVTQSSSGAYTCEATNGAGSATSAAATLTVVASTTPGKLVNISSRCLLGAGPATFITGFVVSGEASNSVLLRSVGPTLSSFGITNPYPNPIVSLFDTANPPNQIAGDAGWQTPPSPARNFWEALVTPVEATEADFASVGAFALVTGSDDSAMKIALPAGSYTFLDPTAGGNSTGVALAEVYTDDPGTQLIDISSRSFVGNGADILIAGFAISGTTSETILLRASGPALEPFGVSGTLPDPEVQLFDSNQNLVASNFG
jgi:hypothetical protein